MAETEQVMKQVWETIDNMTKQNQETGKKLAELGKQVTELGKHIKRVSDNVDRLNGRWGRFIESYFCPGIAHALAKHPMFAKDSIIFTPVKPYRQKRNIGNETMEVDYVGVSEEMVVVGELKSFVGAADVDEHLETLDKFKTFFPEYAEKMVMGVIGGVEMYEATINYVGRCGLFLLAQTGDNITVQNDEHFNPAIW